MAALIGCTGWGFFHRFVCVWQFEMVPQRAALPLHTLQGLLVFIYFLIYLFNLRQSYNIQELQVPAVTQTPPRSTSPAPPFPLDRLFSMILPNSSHIQFFLWQIGSKTLMNMWNNKDLFTSPGALQRPCVTFGISHGIPNRWDSGSQAYFNTQTKNLFSLLARQPVQTWVHVVIPRPGDL